MIDVATVRLEIADFPKRNGPDSAPPEFLGFGDGARVSFALRFRKADVSSVDVEFGLPGARPDQGIAYRSIARADATYLWTAGLVNGRPVVTFGTPPPAGQIVSGRYDVTRFTDAELQGFIDRATVRTTDQLTLKSVQFDIIPAELSDPDRMEVRRIGDTSFDSSSYQRTMLALRESLRKDLTTQSGAAAGPAMRVGRTRGRW